MKILYFILGSFDSKIINWGLSSFDSLLKQDIVFFGPIKEASFKYNNKDYKLIRFFEETTINNVFEQLPIDWTPDIVICDTSVLNYIMDIYKCPVKTFLRTSDAWADTVYNRRIVEFFDFFSYGVIDREQYNNFDSEILPVSGAAVSVPKKQDNYLNFNNRNIDVISIANYSSGFYHDRFKTFYKVSQQSNSTFLFKVVTGISRKEIHKYYQNSKIVLDWSHTLSNRSYEAALNKCLLFSNEENSLVSAYWTPWEEYIPYNEHNLVDLLSYYIYNPDKSQRIIENMHNKIKGLNVTMGGLIIERAKYVIGKEVDIQARIDRVEKLDKCTFYNCLATPLAYNYHYRTDYPDNWKKIYFSRINTAISQKDCQEKKARIKAVIEGARISFLLKDFEKSKKYISILKEEEPDYAWLYYLEGRIALKENNDKMSSTSFQESIKKCRDHPGLLTTYVLPYTEKENICDNRRIVGYIWKSNENKDIFTQESALLFTCYEQLGDYYYNSGIFETAEKYFLKAYKTIALYTIAKKLVKIKLRNKKYKEINIICKNLLENSPYAFNVLLYKCLALLQLKNNNVAKKEIKENIKAFKAFSHRKSFKWATLALRFLLINLLINPKLCIVVLQVFINRVDKKV